MGARGDMVGKLQMYPAPVVNKDVFLPLSLSSIQTLLFVFELDTVELIICPR
jgi:hypothetical protein